ncbi:Crp/Fnr family transcriptional regulator [Flavobacterium sp. ARAG 55.4]|uniref:Crp/Fnr family transcriptional regulator n=1 Tax=Flavobacterium sp. ARAG 55.4 TaxID=3451357 RepID=UPI003F45D3CD
MLSGENISLFKKVARKLELKKKDFFVCENQLCDLLGIVESGTLYSYFEDADGNFIVNELYSSNAIITSYRSFSIGIPSPAFIKVYSDAIIYVVDKEQYNELIFEHEFLLLFKNIIEELFINKCFKETSLVRLKAKQRYRELINVRTNIEQDFPQHLIASYLKIRPETLSRLKSLDLHQDKK